MRQPSGGPWLAVIIIQCLCLALGILLLAIIIYGGHP